MAPVEQSDNLFEDPLLYTTFPFEAPGDPRNPHTEWARIRATTPVEFRDNPLAPGGAPLVTLYRHADVVKALRDHQTFSSSIQRQGVGGTDETLLSMEEPVHGRYRNLIAAAFRPRLLARWEETLIVQVVNELLDAIVARGRADLVRDFNFALPAQVIARILGLPREDFHQFQLWAMDMVANYADPVRGNTAGLALKAYYRPLVEQRRAAPEDDLISELIITEVDGQRLGDEEIDSFLLLLMAAGVETTYRVLGSMMFYLLGQPEQFIALNENFSLLPKAIEETLRIEPPFQSVPRIAAHDTSIGGYAVPRGSLVLSLLGAANRDPAFVQDPDKFDLRRPNVGHLAFGHGVHLCLGMHLARMELKVAIRMLLDRLPNLRFDSERAMEIDAHIHGKTMRSPTAVPVLWDT